MKTLKLYFFLFPLISLSQNKIDVIREKFGNKYEYIYDFENDYAVFRTFDNKMGVMDSNENVIIKPIFTFIHNNNELKNLFEVGNKVNKKFKRGFIDLKGTIKIPIIYDNVFYVEKGLIKVTFGNKMGVLDTLNHIILPTKYDNISFDNDLIIAEIKGNNSLYDFKGKQISDLQFSDISYFTDNKAIVTFQNKTNAIIDHKANIVLKSMRGFSFDRILKNDLFVVKSKLNKKEGIINLKGDFMIQCKYDEINQVKSYFIVIIKGKKGFVSLNDDMIKPIIYDEIYFNDDKTENSIVIQNNLYGVVNPNFRNDIIPIRYKNIKPLFESYYIVLNNEDKNGLYNQSGEKVTNEAYKFFNVNKNSIFATKNQKPILIHLEKNTYQEEEILVDELVSFTNMLEYSTVEYQIFKTNNKFGVLNFDNQIVIPAEYDLIENIYLLKEFIVKKNNKFGVINTENKVVVAIEFDGFERLKESIVFKKGKEKKYYY